MKKGRRKTPKTRKYVSLMIVPHNSNRVKTLKTTHPFSKLFLFLTSIVLVIAFLSISLAYAVKENRELREEYMALNSFLVEQQNIARQNIAIISEIESFDKLQQINWKNSITRFRT